MKFLNLLGVLLIVGCSHLKRPSAWQAFHQGDPHLLGVRVQQIPDSGDDEKEYKKGHPAMVLYVFDDYRVHQLGFTPQGAIKEDFWWNLSDKDKYILQTLQSHNP